MKNLNEKLFLIISCLFILFALNSKGDKLENGFERLKKYDYFQAKEYFEKSLESKQPGAAYGLSVIFSEDKNPFYNLDSARKYILISDSTFGDNVTVHHDCCLSNVLVGDFSYVSSASHLDLTQIGKFCSIGNQVLCGCGDHPVNLISTNPVLYSTLKLGAKIYGPTTIGPHSKVGGEVNNSVIFGYTNKAHDGFLGNAVLGEWCIIGADSNNSNLKNNYAEVKLWNYQKQRFVLTGLTFCGLIMGDHSKCGINTMFNTGTLVGVSANIFGAGFPRNFVPSFSWGGAAGFSTYNLKDAFEVATRVFERRNMIFNDTEKDILTHVFELTEQYRK